MAGAVRLPFTQRSGLGRCNVAGADAVALDVVLSVFGADVAGEHLETALCSGVCAYGFTAQLTHHGADVDDLALTALHHFRHHGGAADVRAHKVYVYHPLEFGPGHLMHGDALDDTGVVHKNVNLADFLVDAFHKSLHGDFVGYVADIAVDIGDTGFLVSLKALFHGGLIGCIENDVLYACFHERLCNGKANSVRSTCNPGVFSFE